MATKQGNAKVDTDAGRAWCQGRNGLAPLAGVHVWEGHHEEDGLAFVDCISRKGRILNGGLAVNARAMDELALQWLDSRFGVGDELRRKVREG